MLQPYVVEAAALCDRCCDPRCSRLQPYVLQVRVEERAPPPQPKGLKLKLSREGEREPTTLLHPPDGSFGELLAAYCAQAGLQAAGYRLQFDGDTLAPAGTPADADMEDGDLVEVVKAR